MSARGTITRTAAHAGSCSGETVGDSMPGAMRGGLVEQRAGQVVVDHHVLPGDEDALQPPLEHLEAGRGARAGDQHRGGLQDDRAEDLEALGPQRRAGLDDVGHGVRDAEPDGGLDRAVEVHQLGADAGRVEERADEAGVARRDAEAGEVARAR